ncbi:MAG: ATP-binding protein [Flavobacteriales bacterium]|jgi:DNA transposition AAA+ family ATPase|nr:ATP-binding protein [Flavobacteriales bacterium]
MEHVQKQRVREDLKNFINQSGSQNKAANRLKGVSAATLSQIVNDNWELINDSMWNKIAAQIQSQKKPWQFAMTKDAQTLFHVFDDAKQHNLVISIVGSEGTGKSESAKRFTQDNKDVYLLNCNEYWDRRWFLKELLKAMGKDPAGMVMAEMMEVAVLTLEGKDCPQIILDEADKLRDQVFYFFITLYNRLQDKCSIVLMATQYLQKRIKRGLSLNKKGYREIYSRLGKRFIELDGVNFTDVVMICQANQVENKTIIKQIYDDCDNDIRRVKRKIHAYKRSLQMN